MPNDNIYDFKYKQFFIGHQYYSAYAVRLHADVLHMHNTAELMLVQSGSATLRIDDEIFKANGSYVVFFPSRSAHFSVNEVSREYSRYCLSLDESYFIGEVKLPKKGFVLPLDQNGLTDLLAPVEQLYRFFADRNIAYDDRLTRRRDSLLRWLLAELESLPQTDFTPKPRRRSYIGEVCSMIDCGISERISLDSLAERFFICKTKLTRDFREETGMSVGDYIIAVRISRARRMLSEGESVAQTAQACGFSGSANFIRFFKQQTGSTPAKCRFV